MESVLSIRGACLHIPMKDGETKEDAVERLLNKLENEGIHLSLWTEEEVEQD